jgi:hypothetical protein
MFTLNRTIARNSRTDLDDTANTKFALTALGYHDDTETGLSPYADDSFFESIKNFQKDHNLTIDGVMNPDGETIIKMNKKLKETPHIGGAFQDFVRNHRDMKEADTIGADKYFHCKANYEATHRGGFGETRSEILSTAREAYGIAKAYAKREGYNETAKDTLEDMAANYVGRETAKSGKFSSSREACAIFRPKGLDDKY